jgi:hypothetical protein
VAYGHQTFIFPADVYTDIERVQLKHIYKRFNRAVSVFPFAPDYIIGILLLIVLNDILGIARLQ